MREEHHPRHRPVWHFFVQVVVAPAITRRTRVPAPPGDQCSSMLPIGSLMATTTVTMSRIPAARRFLVGAADHAGFNRRQLAELFDRARVAIDSQYLSAVFQQLLADGTAKAPNAHNPKACSCSPRLETSATTPSCPSLQLRHKDHPAENRFDRRLLRSRLRVSQIAPSSNRIPRRPTNIPTTSTN